MLFKHERKQGESPSMDDSENALVMIYDGMITTHEVGVQWQERPIGRTKR